VLTVHILGFYLNTAYFANDIPLTFDDQLVVFHGAYCTILEKRTIEEYIWTDEIALEETQLSNIDVVRIQCDNRYRRKSDGTTEFLKDSYVTDGWTFPEGYVTTVDEWDKRIENQ
jgi:hypothetical protein